jgi:hypothetical protein
MRSADIEPAGRIAVVARYGLHCGYRLHTSRNLINLPFLPLSLIIPFPSKTVIPDAPKA